MSQTKNYRVSMWQPPSRPEWLDRVIEEGRCLNLSSVVPLDAAGLINEAINNTGLSDFGDDDWREPFNVLVKSLNEEADLHLMGRLMTRSDLIMHLEARLAVEDTYKQFPEIEDQELARPILITGSGRCGTSAMQNLLALDPDGGTLTHWEAMFPCPPPEKENYESEPRIELADARMTQWNRVTPEIMSMHEFGGAMPTELIQIEAISFQSVAWLGLYGFTPSYGKYMSQRSNLPALNYAKRVLKLLQWKNPRQRWLLKSPYAINYLPEVFQVFPNVELIWMHRDPIKACSSVVSLVGTLLWIRSNTPLSDAAFTQLTNTGAIAEQFNLVLDQIETGVIPESRIHNVQYIDFIEDQLGEIIRVYEKLGIRLSEEGLSAMRRYIDEHPRELRPPHRYNMGDETRRQEERDLFMRYQRHFKVKTEL